MPVMNNGVQDGLNWGHRSLPVAGGTMAGWLAPAAVTLTDAPAITVSAPAGNVFAVTLGGNRTMSNPASPVNGQSVLFLITQDGAGSRTLTWGSAYSFGAGGAPALSTTAGATDILGFVYSAATGKWLYAGSSGAAAYQPWQFHVSPIGGAADDTANIQAAINNAVTYATANQGYAEVVLDPALYTLSSAVSTSGSGYSQLYLPVVGTSQSCVTLVIRSTWGNGAPMPYFNQTVAQLSGCVLQSTLTGQAYSGTYGTPAILGGPTPEQGYGADATPVAFSNMHVIIDGITLTPPLNPTVSGFYFRGVAKATMMSGAYIPDGTVSQLNSTRPTTTYASGLYMPFTLNADNCEVIEFTAYGAYYGAVGSEHFNAKGLRSIYCENGFLYVLGGHGNHGGNIDYFSVEACQNGVTVSATGSNPFTLVPLNIGLMDVEFNSWWAAGGKHYIDSSNLASGRVMIQETGGVSAIKTTGAANVEILSANQPLGHVSSPTFTLGTALANPFFRNTFVTVTGGTVTGISIDGTATGLTSGTFMWPANKTMTISGTVLPAVTCWCT